MNRLCKALIIIIAVSVKAIAAHEVQSGASLTVRAENNDTMILSTQDLATLGSQPLTVVANQLAAGTARPLVPVEETFALPIDSLVPLQALLLIGLALLNGSLLILRKALSENRRYVQRTFKQQAPVDAIELSPDGARITAYSWHMTATCTRPSFDEFCERSSTGQF